MCVGVGVGVGVWVCGCGCARNFATPYFYDQTHTIPSSLYLCDGNQAYCEVSACLDGCEKFPFLEAYSEVS